MVDLDVLTLDLNGGLCGLHGVLYHGEIMNLVYLSSIRKGG